MLTVEERHEIIQKFERAVSCLRESVDAHRQEHALDAQFARAIATETVQREFYAALNAATDWGLHPAGKLL